MGSATPGGSKWRESVEEVSTELSNLVDKLGIAEASLTGEQKELQGRAKREARESRSAVTNLSNRLDKLVPRQPTFAPFWRLQAFAWRRPRSAK